MDFPTVKVKPHSPYTVDLSDREIRADGSMVVQPRASDGREIAAFRIDGKKRLAENPYYQFDAQLWNRIMFAGRDASPYVSARADAFRADAASGIALARELEYVSAIPVYQPLSDLTALTLFQMAPDQPAPFQEVYTKKLVTSTSGNNRSSRNYDDIGKRGDLTVAKSSQNIAARIRHASWNYADLARAALANIPLSPTLLLAEMRTINEEINDEFWFGDASEGLLGFYNQTGCTPSVVANGAGGSPLWSSKTPDEIEKDVMEIITTQISALKGNTSLQGDHLAFDTLSYLKLATTARSQVTSMTILDFAKQALAAVGGGEITSHPELVDNGSGARWMAFWRNQSNVIGKLMPVSPRLLPPTVEGMGISQPMDSQSGGLFTVFGFATQIRYGM